MDSKYFQCLTQFEYNVVVYDSDLADEDRYVVYEGTLFNEYDKYTSKRDKRKIMIGYFVLGNEK